MSNSIHQLDQTTISPDMSNDSLLTLALTLRSNIENLTPCPEIQAYAKHYVTSVLTKEK